MSLPKQNMACPVPVPVPVPVSVPVPPPVPMPVQVPVPPPIPPPVPISAPTPATAALRPQRQWLKYNPIGQRTKFTEYTLMSYNVQAKFGIHMSPTFKGVPRRFLDWSQRRPKFADEFLAAKADMFFLQNVQFDHLRDIVNEIEDNRRCMDYLFKNKGVSLDEGCAIVYDSKKFELIAHRTLEFAMPRKNVKKCHEYIAIVAKFGLKQQIGKSIIVCCTKFMDSERSEELRICQVRYLLLQLHLFCNGFIKQNNSRLPILLGGDFGFGADSKAFELLCAPSPNVNNPCDVLQLVPIIFGRNTASTFRAKWTTEDHIFIAKGKNQWKITILEVCKLPSKEECAKIGFIPNALIASNHYPLLIKFTV